MAETSSLPPAPTLSKNNPTICQTRGGRAPPWLHASPRVDSPNQRIEEYVGEGVTPWTGASYDDAPKGSPSGPVVNYRIA